MRIDIRPAQDFGMGGAVARETRGRMLGKDGKFNVRRAGLGFFESWSAYHWALNLTWPRFLGLLAAGYVALNVAFALAYRACGPAALPGPDGDTLTPLAKAFFFSVETFGTIGYGHVSPRGLPANLLVTAESFISLVGLALVTGMIFARFARPLAKIYFSEVAVIAPFQGGTAFMFRIANMRRSELLEVRPRVSLSRHKRDGTKITDREFHELPLERDRVVFFPLSWTIVHPIDESSPLWGVTEQQLKDSDAEFMVYVTALDETFSQVVHARTSYRSEEVIFGARFTNVIDKDAAGIVRVDVRRVGAFEKIED